MPAAIAVPLISAGIGGAATVGATAIAGRGQGRAARAQMHQANYAADLEAKAAERALNFAQVQENRRRFEWEETQRRNKAIYDAEMARDQQRYDTQQRHLAPYRAAGRGSLGQLARPIPGFGGSLGARMGG